jgi:hypothetical protein
MQLLQLPNNSQAEIDLLRYHRRRMKPMRIMGNPSKMEKELKMGPRRKLLPKRGRR